MIAGAGAGAGRRQMLICRQRGQLNQVGIIGFINGNPNFFRGAESGHLKRLKASNFQSTVDPEFYRKTKIFFNFGY